ncbi:MAG TPA: hypothetical protein DHW02_23495 [Ktedonobacter sp.]|jgi:DNA-binding MarR family transcriptional regulator|nr:hypothetical protein [Ktedonobacter sp.]
MNREQYMANEQLIDDVQMLYHLIRRASHPVKRAEMTPEQYWLLRLLRRRGTLSIGELAEILGVTGSSVTTACKRLEKVGFVTRERQSDDERKVMVMLTEQGNEQIEAWQQRRRAFLQTLLVPLDEEQQSTLQHLLERILYEADQDGNAPLQ